MIALVWAAADIICLGFWLSRISATLETAAEAFKKPMERNETQGRALEEENAALKLAGRKMEEGIDNILSYTVENGGNFRG